MICLLYVFNSGDCVGNLNLCNYMVLKEQVADYISLFVINILINLMAF